MGWIIMQPSDDKQSGQAEKSLIKNGECNIYITKMEQYFNLQVLDKVHAQKQKLNFNNSMANQQVEYQVSVKI